VSRLSSGICWRVLFDCRRLSLVYSDKPRLPLPSPATDESSGRTNQDIQIKQIKTTKSSKSRHKQITKSPNHQIKAQTNNKITSLRKASHEIHFICLICSDLHRIPTTRSHKPFKEKKTPSHTPGYVDVLASLCVKYARRAPVLRSLLHKGCIINFFFFFAIFPFCHPWHPTNNMGYRDKFSSRINIQ
jgi:hypothetical protein